MRDEHIHTFDDGRGNRDVFLDGKLIKYAVYADTKRGVVKVIDQPPRLDAGGELVESTLTGLVEIVLHTHGHITIGESIHQERIGCP
jgi:hypothetical protein